MKLLALLVVVVVALAFADETCSIDEKTLQKGETYQRPDRCELFECIGSGSVGTKICPIPFGHRGCLFIKADLAKPYPDCCLKIECPKDNPPLFIG